MSRNDPGSGSLRIVLSHVYSWPEVRRGGERYLHELASALVDAGHQVRVISSAPRPGHGRILGVPVTYLRRRSLAPKRFGSWGDEMAFGIEAGAWSALRGIDVWHALGTSDAAAATIMGRVRDIRSVHTALGIPNRWYMDSRPDDRLHDLVVRHVDAYVCLSLAARRALTEGWGRDPFVVGGGVDLRRFVPAARRHSRPALLYSGSFAAGHKRLPLLLEAMAILRKRLPDVELWLSGSGDVSALLGGSPAGARGAMTNLGVGSEEEQASRYGRAWVTVLPSENEAFGLCLVESLACGTPIVVAADSGGPAELVREGIGIASKSSAFDLADACEAALELATLPGTVEACRVEAKRYDWRGSIVPQLEEIYRV